MSLRFEMIADIVAEQRLSGEMKETMQQSLDYWMNKSHFSVSIPLSILARALVGNNYLAEKAISIDAKLAPGLGDLSVEFVFLSPKEMELLDPDEKSGMVMGDCIFIAHNIPEDFVALVAANLKILAMLKDDNPVSRLLKASKVNIDTEKHWTANILDISLAERLLDKDSFQEYLRWRKGIERTNFFRDTNVNDILAQRLSFRRFKRTTHPYDRGKYARRSWYLSGALAALGTHFEQEWGRAMGVSNVDRIYRKLVKDQKFNPNNMLLLLSMLKTHKEQVRIRSRMRWKIEVPAELQSQAYLLTGQVQGNVPLLELTTQANTANTYLLSPSAGATIEALEDRIAYFARATLLENGMSPKMIAFVKSAVTALPDPAGAKDIKLTLPPSEAAGAISEEVAIIDAQIGRINDLLEQYARIEAEISKLETVEIMPAALQEEKEKLVQVKGSLMERRAKLTRDNDIVSRLLEVTKQSGALLAAIVPEGEGEKSDL